MALKLLKTPWKIPFPSPLIVVSSGCDWTRDYWICIMLEAHVGIWNFHICFPVKLLELFFSSKTTFPLYLFHFFFQEAQIFLEEEDEILSPATEERNNLWGVVKVQLTIPEEVVINYLQGLLSGELHKRFRRIGMKDVILPLLARLVNKIMRTVHHFLQVWLRIITERLIINRKSLNSGNIWLLFVWGWAYAVYRQRR